MPSTFHTAPTDVCFRTLVQAVEDYAILMLAPSGHVLTWNAGAERMNGYSADEVANRHFSDLYLLDDFAAHEANLVLAEVRANGRFESEGWGTRRDGAAFRAHFAMTPIAGDANSPRGFALAVRELTARTCVVLKPGRAGRLAARIQEAREEEQVRIARELHDDLGQQFATIKMAVARLELDLRNSGAMPAQVAAGIQDLGNLVDGTMVSLRRIAAGLRSIMLQTLGLVPALEWLVEEFTRRHGVAVEATLHADGLDSTDRIAEALFHIVQEALTNVARHARARRVVIRLRCDDGHCLLTIDDDGQGATAEKLASNETSFGLVGMRERVDHLGGTMLIETASGRGLRIAIAIPLDRADAEA